MISVGSFGTNSFILDPRFRQFSMVEDPKDNVPKRPENNNFFNAVFRIIQRNQNFDVCDCYWVFFGSYL